MLLVLTSFPSSKVARAAAEVLVSESLAACVNLPPRVESISRWEGKLERSAEVLAIIKTTSAAWPGLEVRLRQLHPYQVPEIVAVSREKVSAVYLRWLTESVRA